MYTRSKVLMCGAAILLMAACSRKAETPEAEQTAPPPAASTAPATGPNTYKVRFTTSKGPFVVEVHRDWAPIGAARFEELVKAGFYDDSRFFRVVPNFVVQFGLAAKPAMTKKWDKPLKDDPVLQTNRTD
jgi:peptidyl-prolyl cis-trans isomerase A (cyclophilin A)